MMPGQAARVLLREESLGHDDVQEDVEEDHEDGEDQDADVDGAAPSPAIPCSRGSSRRNRARSCGTRRRDCRDRAPSGSARTASGVVVSETTMRDGNGRAQGHGKFVEEPADQSAHQQDGDEDGHQRSAHGDDGEADLARAQNRRLRVASCRLRCGASRFPAPRWHRPPRSRSRWSAPSATGYSANSRTGTSRRRCRRWPAARQRWESRWRAPRAEKRRPPAPPG